MRRLLGVLFIFVVLLCSCERKKPNYPYSKLSFEDFQNFRNSNFTVDNNRLLTFIDSLRLCERDTQYIDILTNHYYAERSPYLWISRTGIDMKIDTLLHWLAQTKEAGLSERTFYLRPINESLKRLHELDFDKTHTASRTMATLEYYLTKSYMRYASGQRFGYINPQKLFNKMEKVEEDSAGSPYRTLFNITIDRVNKKFFDTAVNEVALNNTNEFLTEVQPTSKLYHTFLENLQKPGLSKSQRRQLIINLERSRWRMKSQMEGRYVLVNIPSQTLCAIDDDKGTSLSMKVCFGSPSHKTPLLTSSLTHLELNPYWIIPRSIIKKDIVDHAGDTAYFSKRKIKIVERQTGEFVSPLHMTSEMLLSNSYLIRQDKGENNSLGKLIFRFPNPFSIYLHDTNNHEVFNSNFRSVSHGCIRLENPFDLAMFLLKDTDEEYFDKIRLAIGMPPLTEKGKEMEKEGKGKGLKRCDFKQPVPLFIVYFTCYPDMEGRLQYYPDIYKYDDSIWSHLNSPQS